MAVFVGYKRVAACLYLALSLWLLWEYLRWVGGAMAEAPALPDRIGCTNACMYPAVHAYGGANYIQNALLMPAWGSCVLGLWLACILLLLPLLCYP